MSASEDLTKIPDRTLLDILLHIQRERYPARYQAVRDEFVRRHGVTVEGMSVDDYFDRARRQRPFAERWTAQKRVLLAILAWSGLMLAIKGVLFIVALLRVR